MLFTLHELASVNVWGLCSQSPQWALGWWVFFITKTDSTRHSSEWLSKCTHPVFFSPPRKMPPPRKISAMIHKPYVSSLTSSLPFLAEFSCSGPFTRHHLRITDCFFCFIHIFILILFLTSDVFDLSGSSWYYSTVHSLSIYACEMQITVETMQTSERCQIVLPYLIFLLLT